MHAHARRDVEATYKEVQQFLTRWRELLSTQGDAEEFQWTTDELNKKLKSMTWDLEDLTETIDIHSPFASFRPMCVS